MSTVSPSNDLGALLSQGGVDSSMPKTWKQLKDKHPEYASVLMRSALEFRDDDGTAFRVQRQEGLKVKTNNVLRRRVR